MRNLKISQCLHYVLVTLELDDFTIPELRDAFCMYANSNSRAEHKDIYKTMYRQVEKLVRKKLLIKIQDHNGSARYKRTEAFKNINFDICAVTSIENNKYCEMIVQEKMDAPKQSIEEQLRNLAGIYKVDLLTCIGESEEYIRLYSDFPELKFQLEPKYHESRERSSKLLGKIKALDTVLSQLSNLAN